MPLVCLFEFAGVIFPVGYCFSFKGLLLLLGHLSNSWPCCVLVPFAAISPIPMGGWEPRASCCSPWCGPFPLSLLWSVCCDLVCLWPSPVCFQGALALSFSEGPVGEGVSCFSGLACWKWGWFIVLIPCFVLELPGSSFCLYWSCLVSLLGPLRWWGCLYLFFLGLVQGFAGSPALCRVSCKGAFLSGLSGLSFGLVRHSFSMLFYLGFPSACFPWGILHFMVCLIFSLTCWLFLFAFRCLIWWGLVAAGPSPCGK